jgi:hypothetical protein
VSKARRTRRLVPDQALYDRRVNGEPLRGLALDYGVTHTTLLRHFRRSDAKVELREARRRFDAERKARQERLRRLKHDVQRRAREDKERDRQLAAWRPSNQPGYLGWLDDRDAPKGLSSRERFSMSDDLAEPIVEAGGGVEQVIDATGLRTPENVLRNVDSQTMRRAIANDLKFPSNARPDTRGLRRLAPDSELIRRRAAKESVRSIAADYGVSHTTILRYFERPPVAKQLLRTQRRGDRPRGVGQSA